MKRHTFIYLAALLTMLGTVLPLSAQQTQDALYIYRNDGKFNGFFYADIDRFEYSKVDTLGVEHDEFVVQEVYALDSVFRIPLNAIDSIAFVTPETQYQPGVTTAESTLWNYVVSSDSMTTFTLSASTPQSLVPKVGDKLANPTATPFLPGGFFGQVASVTKSGAGTVVKCSQVDPSELFKRFIGKFAGRAETEEAAARRRADANPPNYNATETYIPLPPIKVDVDLNKGWALGGFGIKLNDNFSVTGEGNFTFSLEPTLLVRSFFEVSQEDGTFFDMTTRLQMTTDLSLEAKVEATASLDMKVFETKFPLGSTGLWAVYENGSTFGLTGSLSAFMKWHNVTSAYGMLQWIKGYKEEGAGTINVLTNDFNWGLSGSVGMNMGIYHQVKVEAVHKLIAEAALRFETGLKAELGSDLSFTDLLTLGSPVLMSLLDSRSYYQKLNRDLALKFGLYGNGKLSITLVGGMVTKDFTIYDKEAMNVDWPHFSLVPNFKSLKWEVDEKRPWRGIVTASLDRKLAYPLSVGQALFEKSKNEFYSHAFEDNKYSSPNDFKSYTYGYEYLQPGKNYRVYPTVGFNIPFYQTLMADKYVDFTLGPPAITFEPGSKLEVSPFAGSKQVVVKTNMYNTEMEDPKNASWLRTSYLKDDADLKVYFDELPDNLDSRRAAIHFIGRDSLNTNILKEDSIVVTQLRASIKADPGTLEFDAKGGEKTVKLTTTVEDLSVQFGYNKDNFCKYTFDAKKNTITVTVPENKAKDERSASIIVSGVSPGGQKAECRIDVFQDGTGGDDPGPGPGPGPGMDNVIYVDGAGTPFDLTLNLLNKNMTGLKEMRLLSGTVKEDGSVSFEESDLKLLCSGTLKDGSDPMKPVYTFYPSEKFYGCDTLRAKCGFLYTGDYILADSREWTIIHSAYSENALRVDYMHIISYDGYIVGKPDDGKFSLINHGDGSVTLKYGYEEKNESFDEWAARLPKENRHYIMKYPYNDGKPYKKSVSAEMILEQDQYGYYVKSGKFSFYDKKIGDQVEMETVMVDKRNHYYYYYSDRVEAQECSFVYDPQKKVYFFSKNIEPVFIGDRDRNIYEYSKDAGGYVNNKKSTEYFWFDLGSPHRNK